MTSQTPNRSRHSRHRSEAAGTTNPFDRKQSHNPSLPSIDFLARTEDKGRYGKDSKTHASTRNIDAKKLTIDTSPKTTGLGDDFAKFHMSAAK